ncbi:MAG: imidazoleglycerol-phosphate dehydratase [Spirochaetes bacterium]|nr:MAG: imidazoleglycerol-phosphate dehydratase [Spirochaetota bacterium]
MNAENGTYVVVRRKSKETDLELRLYLEAGRCEIDTGIGFFDHMLGNLARHGGFGLELRCRGDLTVDDHHTVEDCAIALGKALGKAAELKGRIRRFGGAYAPLDEALARAVVDFSGRPWCEVDLGAEGGKIGNFSTENGSHFFQSLAFNAQICLHLDLLKGNNSHHRLESAFKAFALALRQALEPQTGQADREDLPETTLESTKGKVSLEVYVESEKEATNG